MWTEDGMEDAGRIQFYRSYIGAALYCKICGVKRQVNFSTAYQTEQTNLRAFTVWLLMDSFEWQGGFYAKFGLYNVDFK